MSNASIWDDPDMKVNDDYIKFEAIGDTVSGTVTTIRPHRFDDGKVVPQVLLTTDDGEEKTMTAGQVQLKAKLAEQRPEAGDHIKVTLSDIEKRAGGKTLKHFTVEVGRAGAVAATQATAAAPVAQPAPTPAAAPVTEGVDQAALTAALGNLTAEQKAQLGIPG